MIDFEIPDEAKAVRAKVRAFVHEHCIPADEQLGTRPFKDILAELRVKARAEGLWCPFIPVEYGGMGLVRWPTHLCRWNSARVASAPWP